jgi:hypothetical protein
MTHFAQLDKNDNVITIIVCDKEAIESGLHGDPKQWVETDPGTIGGVHYGEDGNPDGGTPLRGNYAYIGGVYDRNADVFYTRQPFPSWVISAPDWTWTPPVPKPPRSDATVNVWNESKLCWEQVPRV